MGEFVQPEPGSDGHYADLILFECFTEDTELDHCRADELLVQLIRQLGYTKTAAAYEEVRKWYA